MATHALQVLVPSLGRSTHSSRWRRRDPVSLEEGMSLATQGRHDLGVVLRPVDAVDGAGDGRDRRGYCASSRQTSFQRPRCTARSLPAMR